MRKIVLLLFTVLSFTMLSFSIHASEYAGVKQFKLKIYDQHLNTAVVMVATEGGDLKVSNFHSFAILPAEYSVAISKPAQMKSYLNIKPIRKHLTMYAHFYQRKWIV